jgi:hypothetical protein
MKAIDLAMSLYCDLERAETNLPARDNSEAIAKANTEMAVLGIYGWAHLLKMSIVSVL